MVSEEIRRAIESLYPAEECPAVLEALERIDGPSRDYLQGVVLALSHGDRAGFEEMMILACVEARDALYCLESPGVFRPGLTRAEVVRRYRALGLPVPAVLASDG